MAFATIPGIKCVGEAIVDEACDGADEPQVQDLGDPNITGRAPPNFDRAVCADVEATRCVDAMQAAANVSNGRAIARQSLWLEVDVAERDDALTRRAREPAALPADPLVTDGAFAIVPDGELRIHSAF